jgi:hypothetical protein
LLFATLNVFVDRHKASESYDQKAVYGFFPGLLLGYLTCRYKISFAFPIYKDFFWKLKVTVLLKWIWFMAMPALASNFSHSVTPYPVPITLLYVLPIVLHALSEEPHTHQDFENKQPVIRYNQEPVISDE